MGKVSEKSNNDVEKYITKIKQYENVIMLGHAAEPEDNHISTLKVL